MICNLKLESSIIKKAHAMLTTSVSVTPKVGRRNKHIIPLQTKYTRCLRHKESKMKSFLTNIKLQLRSVVGAV
jgi:hypothetical protein